MIITPYSAEHLELTSANFPALKHCFQQSGLNTTAKTATDSVGGVVVTAATSITNDATGFYMTGAQSMTGSWADPGATKASIWMVNGTFDSATALPIRFGESDVDAGVDLGGGINGAVAVDQITNYASYAASGIANSKCIAIAVAADGLTAPRYVIGATDVVTTTAASVTGDLNSLICSDKVAFSASATMNIMQVLVWHFDSTPGDALAAIAWMTANPGYGYPGWKART
jgi:hypothetical protein